jgi:hypothetical protein
MAVDVEAPILDARLRDMGPAVGENADAEIIDRKSRIAQARPLLKPSSSDNRDFGADGWR